MKKRQKKRRKKKNPICEFYRVREPMALFLHHQVAPEREIRPNADWSWGRFDSTFSLRRGNVKTTGKTKITGETATNVYVSLDIFVVCLCILRTNKTWDFLTWPSNITNCNSCDPEDHECGDKGQLLVFWIRFLASQSGTANMDTLEFMILVFFDDVLWNTCGNIIFIHFQSWNAWSIFWAHIGQQLTPLISVVKQPRLYWKCGNASVPFVQIVWCVMVDVFFNSEKLFKCVLFIFVHFPGTDRHGCGILIHRLTARWTKQFLIVNDIALPPVCLI